MASVTSFTAERIAEIEAGTVVSGTINGSGHLILTKHDGTTIDAGYALLGITDGSLAGIKLANNAIDNTKAADMPANTIKGNNITAPADPKDLTVTQTKAMLGLDQVSNVSQSSSAIGITGEIRMWSGATAPAGWAICDGTAISRTTYATLYSVVGTLYGPGDGTTTFNIPDFKGRSPVGVGLAVATGATTHTLAQKGGEEQHVLTTAEMPSHHHKTGHDTSGGWAASSIQAGTVGASSHVAGTFSDRAPGSTYYSSLIQFEGGGGGHNNMQPYLGVNFIIKL